MTSYTANSVGINIPQAIIAGIESAAMGSSMKNSALMAVSVGVSNLVPAYANDGSWGSGTEKYIVEPIVSGILYTIASHFVSKGEKDKMLKKFVQGFIVGSSSAAVSGSLYSATMAQSRVPTMYTARPQSMGLRAENKPETAPQFIVS